eukprot:6462866-Amphidinium_carterae.1
MPGLLMCRSGGALRFMLKHVVMDRGVSLKVARYLSGLWTNAAAAAAAAADDDDDGVAGEDRGLMELHTYVGCAAHDSHNSLKWSLAQYYDESDVLSNIHVALEALRVGSARAGVHLWDWLQSVLSVRPVTECGNEETLHKVWCVLGVEANIVAELVEMRLLWRNECLEISEQFMLESGSDWLGKVSSVLLDLWRIGSFCGSRWCTLGSACRSFCCAFLLGFSSMFSALVQKGAITAYEKHGLDKLDEVARTCLVSTALVSWILEALLLAVLQDGRLASHALEYKSLVDEEVAVLDSLPLGVFEVLSSLLHECTSACLQSKILSGSLSCQSYLHMRLWSVLQALPWSLCHGEPEDRLAELLQETEAPLDDVSCKLWALGHSGMATHKLCEVVRLLGQTCWTSHTAEKQHASAAQ